jgi:hypothetical protein
MPTIKNNHGFGAVPILAVFALVLTGTYFGYSYYNSNSQVSIESINLENLSAVSTAENPLMNEGDVLQAAAKPKTPVFNPENKPIRWSYTDLSRNTNKYIMYFTGKDLGKLNNLMDKIRNQNFVVYFPGNANKPCQPDGLTFYTTQYKANVTKFQDDFYMVTLEFKDERPKDCLSSVANPAFFIPGYDLDFVKAPQRDKRYAFPSPISVIEAPSSLTAPTGRTGVQRNAAPMTNTKPFVNIDGLKPNLTN